MRFKCVSKTWRIRISGGSFINAHRRQQQLHDDPLVALVLYGAYKENKRKPARGKVRMLSEQFSKATEVDVSYLDAEIGEIVGSCNGLVCLMYEKFPSRVLLWNPATRQRRWLPSPAVPKKETIWTAGFGLDSASGDYKIVLLSCVYGKTSLCTHVFAKGGTVWRGGLDSGIEGLPIVVWTSPVAADGALHWKFNRGLCGDLGCGVLSFDLSSETLRCADGPCRKLFTICRWKSSLAAFAPDMENGGFYLKTASSYPGGGLHWSKTLKFTLGLDMRLRAVWREQLVLAILDRQGTTLRLVDPKDQGFTLKLLGQHGGPLHHNFEPVICDYVETIISVF